MGTPGVPGSSAWPSVRWPQPSSVQRTASGSTSSLRPLQAPPLESGCSLNIHLEMPNLGSWKPTRRVKFLATSKVFQFFPVERCCDSSWVFKRLKSLLPECQPHRTLGSRISTPPHPN